MTTTDEEGKKLEAELLERLKAEAADAARFPWSKMSGGLYLWQLGYGKPDVELALYRFRKAGLVTYIRKVWKL